MVKDQYLNILSLVWTALILLTAGLAQAKTDQILHQEYLQLNIKQVPPTNYLSVDNIKKINLGFNKASADYIWLATIQYFGGGNPNLPYQSLSEMINTVVTLDPNFEYPYLFGGVVLPWQEEPQEALDLLDAGIKRFPNNGLLYYYAGSIAKLNLKDANRAAGYFQDSIGKIGTPPAASILAGVSLTELDDRQFARAWWEGVLQTEENENIKERARAWLQYLNLVIDLEKLISQVESSTDTKIQSLNDLVKMNILKEVPVSELGKLKYNPQTKKVSRILN